MLLDRKNVRDMYYLTPMQEGILFHSLLEQGSETYFEQFSFPLEGKFQLEHFFKAFQKIVDRHDVFRTVFVFEKVKRAMQVVLREAPQEPTFVDLAEVTPELQLEYLDDFRLRDRMRGFDLAHETAMRMALLRLGANRYEVVWSFHHILMDGWCLGIVGREFFAQLEALGRGSVAAFKPPAPFSRFVNWLEARDKTESLAFWRQSLAGYETQVEIPKRLDATAGPYLQDERIHRLAPELVLQLTHLAKARRMTINSLLQALWGILLGRYSNADDVVFGSIVSGRPAEVEGVEQMVGLFINAIPVRVRCGQARRFDELLAELSQASFAAEPHHYLPLASIQAESSLKQQLINHVVAFENYPMAEEFQQLVAGEGGSAFRLGEVQVFERTNYDFNLVIVPGAGIELRFSFNRRVHDPRLIERIGRQFECLAQQVVARPGATLAELELLNVDERTCLLDERTSASRFDPQAWAHAPRLERGRADQKPSDAEHFSAAPEVLDLFESQVATTPNRCALISGSTTMSFCALDQAANRIARRLRAMGLCDGEMVMLLLESGAEQLPALLAVWKAGAAFVPVDPNLPRERVAEYAADSGAKWLIASPSARERHELDLPHLDPADPSLVSEDPSQPARQTDPARTAYMIYTSGSTGKPKGVLVSQGAIFNTLAWRREAYGFATGDVILQLFRFTFDGFLTSALSPLIAGATVIQADDETRNEPERLARLIRSHQVQHFIIVPSFFQALLEHLEPADLHSVRSLTLAGEKLTPELVARCRELHPHIAFYNEYGPTECAVAATCFGPIQAENPIPIGRPIANTRVLLLDAASRLQPVGAAGEICLAGAGLAQGYHGREALTAERFPQNPFGVGRLYRTGDLGRWDEEGQLHYLGRADDQVKIRGFRVELGEIEVHLQAQAGVRDAVVVTREGQNGKHLCAYVVGENLELDQLKARLATELPDYMLPAFIIELEKMPLNSAGKLDKRALPEPAALGEKSQSPSVLTSSDDPLEILISQVWREVLGAVAIDPETSFFDLGGDSIKAIQVVSRLKKRSYSLQVRDLFDHPTPAALKQVLKPLNAQKRPAQDDGEMPLLPIQRWFFAQNLSEAQHWNQALILRHEGGLDEKRLRKALDALVSHHQALRLCFPVDPNFPAKIGKPAQRLARFRPANEPGYRFERFDLRTLAQPGKRIEALSGTLQASFTLETGPLFAVALFQVRGADHLLLVLHHLIVDGVSWRILLEDLIQAYEQTARGRDLDLGEPSDSIASWGRNLQAYATSESATQEAAFWLALEAENLKPLGHESEDPFEENATLADLRHCEWRLDATQTALLLRECGKTYHTEINDLLLAALSLALHQVFGVECVRLALEGHGRESLFEGQDLSRTLGWFTSWYPVLLRARPAELAAHIKHLKEDLRKIPNKGIGYGILRELNPALKGRLKARPEILFNYLGDLDAGASSGWPFSEYSAGPSNSPESEALYPLSINGQVQAGQLSFRLDYDARRFPDSKIMAFAEAFEQQLRAVIHHCLNADADYTPSDFGFGDLGFDDLDAIGDAVAGLLD